MIPDPVALDSSSDCLLNSKWLQTTLPWLYSMCVLLAFAYRGNGTMS